MPEQQAPRIEDTLVRGYRQLALETPAQPRDLLLRGLDIVLSSIFLMFALLIALPVALVILITSGRPVFYRGERVGRSGRVFTMLKFRTLKTDAESRLGPYLGQELVRRTEDEFTSLGKWLKATQLDEIPQFIIAKGTSPRRPVDPPVFFGELRTSCGVLAAPRRKPGLWVSRRSGEATRRRWPKLAHDLSGSPTVPWLYLRTVVATAGACCGSRRSSAEPPARSRAGPHVASVIASPVGPPDLDRFAAMSEALVHRGPDSGGMPRRPRGVAARRRDHRPRRRRPADQQRGRLVHGRAER